MKGSRMATEAIPPIPGRIPTTIPTTTPTRSMARWNGSRNFSRATRALGHMDAPLALFPGAPVLLPQEPRDEGAGLGRELEGLLNGPLQPVPTQRRISSQHLVGLLQGLGIFLKAVHGLQPGFPALRGGLGLHPEDLLHREA